MGPEEDDEISKEARNHALELMRRFGVRDQAEIADETADQAGDELVPSKDGAKTKVPKGTVKGVGRKTRVKKA